MSKNVYAVRILVETEEDVEAVESRVRGWGEATFEGFVLLDLDHVKTSLIDIDSLAHTLSRMIKSQENMQEVLRDTTSVFMQTNENLREIVGVLTSRTEQNKVTNESLQEIISIMASGTEEVNEEE